MYIKNRRKIKMKKSTRRKQLRACQRKKNYTEPAAKQVVSYLFKKGVFKKAYKCPVCKHWHLTHANKRLVLNRAFRSAGM
jgi:predicted Zn-ribbon and HTH transcriptional regulator